MQAERHNATDPGPQLAAALDSGDLPALFAAVAHARLLLLTPAQPADGWEVAEVDGRTSAVAFTSPTAMETVCGRDAPHRAVTLTHLAANWPSPEWRLSIDPGLPSYTEIDADLLVDVAALAGRPATPLEYALGRALDAGDVEAYLELLLHAEVALPLDVENADEPVVVLFSSAWRLQQFDPGRVFTEMSGADLIRQWPGTAALVADPGTQFGAGIDGGLLAELRNSLTGRGIQP